MVWRALLLLLFVSPLFGSDLAERQNFWTFESIEPSSIHLGVVNAITGDYLESTCDIQVRSVAPLSFRRHLCSSDPTPYLYAAGWSIHELGATWHNQRPHPSGKPNPSECWIELAHPDYGSLNYLPVNNPLRWAVQYFKTLSNTGSGEISGRTNLKNIRVVYRNHPHYEMFRGDGEMALYKFNAKEDKSFYRLEKLTGRLIERTLPSGYWLDYEEHSVTAYNPSKEQLLGWIRYSKVEGGLEVASSDGQSAKLKFDEQRNLRRIEVEGQPWIEYDYCQKKLGDFLNKHARRPIEKRGPGGVLLQIKYYDDQAMERSERKNRAGEKVNHPAVGRVEEVWAPVKPDGGLAKIANFKYSFSFDSEKRAEFSEGSTDVFDPYGNLVCYSYDWGQRPAHIWHYDRLSDGGLKRLTSIRYHYGQRGHPQEGNLLGKLLFDDQDQPMVATTFDYDDRGNILEETIYGHLTGESLIPIEIGSGSKPDNNGVESFTIRQIFRREPDYKDPHANLPLERWEGERGILTSYLEGSDLIASQFVKAAGRIEQRLFNRYDENRILIERIEDDGSGTDREDLTDVQVRTICRIHPVASGNGVGLPEQVERWYWDGSQERLLSAVELRYNERNLLVEADHYDGEGDYRYTLYNEYDLGGRLIHQVDAMGYDHFFEYDHCGNLTAELGPRPGYGSRHFYDPANRRIRTDRFGPGGECQSTHYRYDLNSRCIAEENWLGQTVERSYDSLGRVTMERRPLSETTRLYEYDGQGALVREVDPLGFETVRTLNARSQPLEIRYPDGGSELFLYDLSGREVLHKGLDGLYQRSSYDAMGRLIRVEVGSCEMERAEISIPSKLSWRTLIPATRKGIKQTFQCDCPKVSTFTYAGDRIVSSCDPTGLVRTYGYDGAGRLISERWGDCRRELFYDAMGRECEQRDWFGPGEEEYRSAIQIYDDLDRLIEEVEQESDGTIYRRTTHAYDEVGNEIATVTYGEGGAAQLSTTEFDFLDRPVRQVDPLGNATVTEYLTATNEDGQLVEEIRVTDPLGNVTIRRKDGLDQTVSIEQRDAMGQRVARVEMSYDLNGRCVEERHLLISPLKGGELVTRQEFDAGGRLTRLTEPDGKQTRFTFNDRGQLIAKLAPDGRLFLFEYDGLGRLICERCGDQFYDYSYDLADRLTGSSNPNGERTERVYNELGHLVEERQASGLSIRYLCDLLGRRTRVTLPDGSEIDYAYNGYSLKRVSRSSYSHDYLEFDESGRCLKERRSLDGGEVRRRWDGAGRLISIDSPTYESTLKYDAVGNLTDLMVWDGEGRTSQTYSYDALYQLDGEEGHTYCYDSLNNRVERDGELHEYDDGNQLVRAGGVDFLYDRRGNLVGRSDRSARYRFDHRDRLIEVLLSGGLYRYEYDSFDRRIAKWRIHDGVEERLFYLYDGMNEIAQLSVDGEVEQLRLLGSGISGDVGAVIALELNGELSLPVTNHRGDLVELLSPYGDTFENYRYSAFGEEEVTDSTGRSIEPTNPWRFSSKRVDPETGLIYFGRRYYSPELGRWISRDPEGFRDGPNLYAYVKNRPHELIDPRGTSACQLDPNQLKPFTFEKPSKFSPMRERQADIFLGGGPLPLANHVQNYLKNRFCDPCKPATPHPNWEKRWGGLTSEILYPGGQFSLSPDHRYFGVMNGINTSPFEFDRMIRQTSTFWGGRDVTGIYNADHGTYANLQECLLGLAYRMAPPPALKIVEFCQTVLYHDPKAMIHLCLHSQAAIHGHMAMTLLPETTRKRIVITAIAPACQIPPELCRNVHSFMSMRDFIPFLDFIGVWQNYQSWTLLRPALGAPLFDHAFMSPTFRKSIRDRHDQFMETVWH